MAKFSGGHGRDPDTEDGLPYRVSAVVPPIGNAGAGMLEDYFEELPSRKWEACAEAFDDYCRDDPESGEIQR